MYANWGRAMGSRVAAPATLVCRLAAAAMATPTIWWAICCWKAIAGELFTGGTVLNLFSNGWIAFDLDNDNNGSHRLEVWNGADSLVFSVGRRAWATPLRRVPSQPAFRTADYGQRLLYAVESPEVWFEVSDRRNWLMARQR